jgi:phosphoserine phosphatase
MTAIRRIHLIRHGETNWNREKRAQGQMESVLTSEGKAQATDLSARIGALGIRDVYCSSSARTRQTADILFAGSTLPVQYCDQLREIHMGPWEGLLYTDIRAQNAEQFDAFWKHPHLFNLPGAETFADVQRRATRRLAQILRESPAEDIAIISHGVLIKTILCQVESRPLSQLWNTPAMHNCARSVIEVHDDGSQRITLYADQLYVSELENAHE